MLFAESVAKFKTDAMLKVTKDIQSISLELFTNIILDSPVGDPTLWKSKYIPKGYVGGKFRFNWNTSVGTPNFSTSEGLDPTGEIAIQGAEAVIMTGNATSTYYLSNGLPYGERLEYEGWSSQAPIGMVRVNVAKMAELNP